MELYKFFNEESALSNLLWFEDSRWFVVIECSPSLMQQQQQEEPSYYWQFSLASVAAAASTAAAF